jgi:hypothetical protein
MSGDPTRVAWTWRHAVCASDLAPTTRHVLLTLSMFMNELGESCHPSTADICRYSGLDKKTVLKHVAAAREAGWIDVSQHGYRGQKWKRHEYAARWPDRDLVAPCQPDDAGEGGGAVPPRFEAEKVVESAPEGGGTEGSKVVEHVHQDKTSPENIPNTSPVERDAREADDRKKIDADGWALLKDWPGFAGMPKEPALIIWRTLTADERAMARRRFPAWLELLRRQKKSHIPAPSTYLRERLFADVQDPAEAPPPPAVAAPFGKLWGAVRMADLVKGPGSIPPAHGFVATLIAQGGDLGERERLAHQARHGWPMLKRMDEAAANRRGWTVHPDDMVLERIAETFEQVRVGSDRWTAWQALFEARGWPWLPDPGRQEWVYFPAGGPERLSEFEAAIRGEDDAGGREAAE